MEVEAAQQVVGVEGVGVDPGGGVFEEFGEFEGSGAAAGVLEVDDVDAPVSGVEEAPDRKTPLAGMCDSARCLQATHHPGHRPVWASAADNYRIFIGKIGRGQKAERNRLDAEIQRADRVVAEIDTATRAEATS
ncbi:hypothetical protein [Embleya sp. AB8]|uniref:hypothetical protein n=1 Tax=Embleya sp. AB8 TaxID=3156304 RepID=UPI003C751CF4